MGDRTLSAQLWSKVEMSKHRVGIENFSFSLDLFEQLFRSFDLDCKL